MNDVAKTPLFPGNSPDLAADKIITAFLSMAYISMQFTSIRSDIFVVHGANPEVCPGGGNTSHDYHDVQS